MTFDESIAPLLSLVRSDLHGRFNEVDVLRRQRSRLRASEQGIVVPPYEVLIHPSSACNLLCAWCIGDHIPIEISGRTLDASKQATQQINNTLRDPRKMKRLIEGITSYRKEVMIDGVSTKFAVENIQFSGLIGEPLVSRDAILAVIPLLSPTIRTGLFTNGLLINDECVEKFQHIDYVNVSVDAGTSETYNLLKSRRKDVDAFGTVLKNIQRLTAACAGRSRLVVNASFVMFPENFGEIYEAATLLKDRGVRSLKIKSDISGKRLLDIDQAMRARDLLDRVDKDLVDTSFELVRIHDVSDPGAGSRRFSRCRITELMAAVGSDGNLYPCNYHPRPGGMTYGNAVERPFADIWEGEQRKKLKKCLPSICPEVCDPFKNRSNKLLEAIHDLAERLDSAEVHAAMDRAIQVAGLDAYSTH